MTNGDRRALDRFNAWWDEGMRHIVADSPPLVVGSKEEIEQLNVALDRCGIIEGRERNKREGETDE